MNSLTNVFLVISSLGVFCFPPEKKQLAGFKCLTPHLPIFHVHHLLVKEELFSYSALSGPLWHWCIYIYISECQLNILNLKLE